MFYLQLIYLHKTFVKCCSGLFLVDLLTKVPPPLFNQFNVFKPNKSTNWQSWASTKGVYLGTYIIAIVYSFNLYAKLSCCNGAINYWKLQIWNWRIMNKVVIQMEQRKDWIFLYKFSFRLELDELLLPMLVSLHTLSSI